MWELDHKESWAPKSWCFWTVVLEKTLESPLDSKEVQSVNPKGNQSWIFMEGLMLKLTWCEELTYEKRPWCWEGLKAGGEGDNRRWDGWMASPSRWTWVWASSGSWWWTGKPGMLQSMGSQRDGHWETEQTKRSQMTVENNTKANESTKLTGKGILRQTKATITLQ